MTDRPIEIIHYDFYNEMVHIKGRYKVSVYSKGECLIKVLNEIYGEGSHWIEVIDGNDGETDVDSNL